MSARCDVCGRKPQYGHKVSHSNRKTNRRFMLNLQRRRLELHGKMQNVNVCTRCLRTMVKVDTKVAKAAKAATSGAAIPTTSTPRPAAATPTTSASATPTETTTATVPATATSEPSTPATPATTTETAEPAPEA